MLRQSCLFVNFILISLRLLNLFKIVRKNLGYDVMVLITKYWVVSFSEGCECQNKTEQENCFMVTFNECLIGKRDNNLI